MRRKAFYCTSHFKVPGDICFTGNLLRFEPNPTNKHVREVGVDQYTVVVDARHVLECRAVKMPSKDDDGEHYLQLKLRTLDGVTFCSSGDADSGWFLVFWMRRLLELQEVASQLHERAQGTGEAAPTAGDTSVPFPCLDYAREAVPLPCLSHDLLWQQDAADAAAGPEPLTPPAPPEVPLRPEGVERTLLTQPMAQHISEYLPLGLRLPGVVEWVLRYTPKKHGVSLATLYRNLEDSERTLLIARDTDDHVLGGFAPEAWRPHPRFYGTGDAFVFSLGRCPAGAEPPEPLQVYTWTSRNSHFQYSDHDHLAMGGGDGGHALVIQADMLRGRSVPTATFGNPTLAGSRDFVVRDVEVWALEDAGE